MRSLVIEMEKLGFQLAAEPDGMIWVAPNYAITPEWEEYIIRNKPLLLRELKAFELVKRWLND